MSLIAELTVRCACAVLLLPTSITCSLLLVTYTNVMFLGSGRPISTMMLWQSLVERFEVSSA